MRTLWRQSILGLLAAGLVLSGSALADNRIPSEQEMKTLPAYCPYTQIISKHYGNQQSPTKFDSVTQPYVEMYGADFWHMHHYCFGLVNINRAFAARNNADKMGWLTRSIGEFDYVLSRVGPGVLPEVHTNKGYALILLKRDGAGIAEFKKAIAINPSYPLAYAHLSDYYEDRKKNDLALKTLEEGLTHNPDAKSLLNRYKRLGGKKTFEIPKAVEPEQEEKAEAEVTATPASTEERSDATAEQTPTKESPEPVTAPSDTPNPYCRFCP